jgi:hypothetical protein
MFCHAPNNQLLTFLFVAYWTWARVFGCWNLTCASPMPRADQQSASQQSASHVYVWGLLDLGTRVQSFYIVSKPCGKCACWVQCSHYQIPLLRCRSTNGYPWAPMGTMGTHVYQSVPMGTHGHPWMPMGMYGYPWVLMGTCGYP